MPYTEPPTKCRRMETGDFRGTASWRPTHEPSPLPTLPREMFSFNFQRFLPEQVAPHSPQTLYHAAWFGTVADAVVLISYGADVNAKCEGSTPLHSAALNGRAAMAGLLLKSRAMVNVEDDTGSTPLHIAVAHGRVDVAKVLLDFGADANATDHRRRVPLHLVTGRGFDHLTAPIMTKILLDHGADPTAQDENGLAPLHGASASHRHGEIATAPLSVDKAADVGVDAKLPTADTEAVLTMAPAPQP